MRKRLSKIKIYACLVLIVFSALIPLKALAIKVDYGFYNANDIQFYDPTVSCVDSGGSIDDGGELVGDSNSAKAWCYFLSNGISKNGAAGIIGNMMRESSVTPNKWQAYPAGVCDNKASDRCGYGLVQWTYPTYKNVGPNTLWKFAGEQFPDTSGKVGTLRTQLDYLMHTIKPDALSKLKSPTPSVEDQTFTFYKSYEMPGGTIGDANNTIGTENARKAYGNHHNLPCGDTTATATPPATPAASGTTSGAKPKILLGPGHTGTDASQPSSKDLGSPPITDLIYGNNPELQDVWDVSQIVKGMLENKGYDVLMTKNSAQGGTYQWNRAQQANTNNVDLALEIHTSSPSGSFGNYAETWSQINNGFVTATNSQKVYSAASAGVIAKSKEYATKMAKARKDAGETASIAKTSEAGWYHPTNSPARNTTIVQVWSKVPWIYLEAGADPLKNGQHSGGITDSQKQTYAKGIVNGVIASIPPGSTTDTGCGGGNSEAGGTIVEVAKQELSLSPQPSGSKYRGDNLAWCAGFASWVYKEAGYPLTKGGEPWMHGTVTDLIRYFKKYETYIDFGEQDPQPGDMVMYGGSENPDVTVGEGAGMRHVNLVVSYDASTKTITTIGGNESNHIDKKTFQITGNGNAAAGFGEFWIAGFGRLK